MTSASAAAFRVEVNVKRRRELAVPQCVPFSAQMWRERGGAAYESC